MAGLASCTPSGDPISQTQCTEALARATQTWQVEFYTNRATSNPSAQRIEQFNANQVVNRNGEKPPGEVVGPDDKGVWWAKLPSRPSPDEVDDRRRPGEQHDAPLLQRNVEFTLQCADGTLKTDDDIYRQASRVIRSGQPVTVSFTLGRALKVLSEVPSFGSDRLEPRSEPTPK
jgi:hypothetical protein